MGFDPADVRDIVLTHLDFDHAGGLDDFPNAHVHLMRDERDAALARETLLDRMRYRPQQWGTRHNWIGYDLQGEHWQGFRCVKPLRGVPPEVLLVSMPGHTFGHAAVAIDSGSGWLLHAGDAYFYRAEMDLARPYCTPGLRLYQWMMEKDRRARLDNQRRLRELKRAHGKDVTVFCAHDEGDFETLARRKAEVPAGTRPARHLAAGMDNAVG